MCAVRLANPKSITISDSFGGATAHFGLQDEWSVLLDPPAVLEIMECIFGTPDFVNTSGAGGGDFNTPGSTEYQ